ncbi:MAB_1171c family putative transporter [Streptomyces sp. NPDC002889]|uniref:MAB_1171c family putative transporter n=1 Tax=Streptomyces sp. NPDC002889 TaxID=3364669 RepID=UPI0036B7A418
MNDGLILYIPAVVLIAALAIKLPSLRRTWHEPLMRSVCALLLVGCAVLFLAAPPTIAAVNDLTGVTNFSAPLVYCVLTAFSGSCIVLIINWRGGPPEQVRRSSRACMGAYACVSVAIVVLFALGEAPVERLRDLDTYYANTPFIREMIMMYLVAHAVGGVVLTSLCWRWLRQVDGSLRTGLGLIVLGGSLDVGYLGTKFIAVFARWTGRDWDYLSTYVAPPLASAAALMVGLGFILPLVGQRASSVWRAFLRYRHLRPLWLELQGSVQSTSATMKIAWWSPIGLRLTHREAAIHDGLLSIAPFLSEAVRDHVRATAISQGHPRRTAEVMAEAAMIASACRVHAATDPGAPASASVPALPELAYTVDPDRLVLLSRTVRRRSFVVTEQPRPTPAGAGHE